MYFKMIYKTFILYFYVVLVYRIMGKKEVGKLGIIDLIVSILIAELAAISIENSNDSLLVSIIPITVLVIIQLLLGYISLKNNKFRSFIDGKPCTIIKNGKLNFQVMSKMRYSLDDLLSQLREQGIKSIEEVNYAILENNGKLSIFETCNDYPMPIILDGNIDYDTLKELNKDIKWIKKILRDRNINLDDVFYAFYTKNNTFIIKKSDLNC